MKSWLDECTGNEIILTFPNFRKFSWWFGSRHECFDDYEVIEKRRNGKGRVRVKFWLYSKPEEKKRFWRRKWPLHT